MSATKSYGSALHSQPAAEPFSSPPHRPTIPLHPFKVHIPERDLDDLQARLNSPVDIRSTYENSFAEGKGESYGMTKSWMDEAVAYWRDGFDWRKVETEINSFPNFTTALSTRSHTLTIHFLALFSENPKAIPLILTHGWPGSILEFLPLMKHLTTTYTPETLPVHIIVPSLVGFGFSSPPPRHDTFSNVDVADLWDSLMRGLGFESYVAQGGDIGSSVARLLGERYPACKAVHVNMWTAKDPNKVFAREALDEYDTKNLERLDFFAKYEFAYRDEHATKTATIGMVVESSPIAMLAWIGEKFLVWSDEDPSLDTILSDVSLYWLTHTFATSLYHYRNSKGQHARTETQPSGVMDKPIGYSLFPKEIRPMPIDWVKEDAGNLVWSKRHDKGGHFAALERPVELWEDVLDFVQQVWK